MSFNGYYRDEAMSERVFNWIRTLEQELETERMRLAACGVAAACNTRETHAKQLLTKESPYWSASYGDVTRAVEQEMDYREALEDIHENAYSNGGDWCEGRARTPLENPVSLRRVLQKNDAQAASPALALSKSIGLTAEEEKEKLANSAATTREER